ncbi:hypothetical protein BT69DRAFT_1350398 [Atractiella rhizophila]|nr:hypothetical protein BT69DRAFT_1350398 [Atractiella rhizophila]
MAGKGEPAINSPDIQHISLHRRLPLLLHVYILPFIFFYPFAAYAYYIAYDQLLGGEEWTFALCVTLFGGHALSWLGTRWSPGFRVTTTSLKANDVETAQVVCVVPQKHKGKTELVELKKNERLDQPPLFYFNFQKDKYLYDSSTHTFSRVVYPCDEPKTMSYYQSQKGLSAAAQEKMHADYGLNIFDIPVPTFKDLFIEQAQAPFFVFQVFCVSLWMIDEYWYYSIFTGFMLVVFECTVVWQRLRTVNEFRTMSIKPYPILVHREGKWIETQTDALLPGDLVSVTRTKEDSGIACDLLLLRGSCIVNEAMLSGESTPLLKESIELRDGREGFDMNGADKNSVLFGGTKVLQATTPSKESGTVPPDGGCVALVLRTGFGTSQGQLIRTMIFSSEKVGAGNWEAFAFIAFLLVFAIAASAYVWIKGLEDNRPKGKLLLDCVIIITSVVPPELPMELSMAVNASLVALGKYAIFCTEPFRIPFAGKVDVCCFDKTGTITSEELVLEGVAGAKTEDLKSLIDVRSTSYESTLTIAAAHALVLLDDGVVGDPMEKATLDALEWKVNAGDNIAPASKEAPNRANIEVKRRYQFSSALKRMSTVSWVSKENTKKTLVAVKGAPETLKGMYKELPREYEATYKHFAQRGSRVLALGYKWIENLNMSQINSLPREKVESDLTFAGFLVFTSPLKEDAVRTLRMLIDSSHRCIMITGDNPLTASHVARDVEIVDREVMILDRKEEGAEKELVWRTVDDRKVIPVDVTQPIDPSIWEEYDICMTGAALAQYEGTPMWLDLVQHTWVYARVSPAQKEYILTTLKSLGFTTLMAGDGTNDVGALKQAHVGVALLNGTMDDLKKIAEHQRNERIKKVYETQLKMSARFGQPPPPPPKAIQHLYPNLQEAQRQAAAQFAENKRKNPMEKFNLEAITSQMADLDDEDQPPVIKLGDASVAAPFTSKLSNVSAITNIIRQGRCTLVATTQMFKILGLNCLISAYSLSVIYLEGIKFGDYQVTITGMLMSVCFLCISRAKPIEKLSRERPLSSIFNFYVIVSILLQFAIHIASMLYIGALCEKIDPRKEKVDLEAEFKPSLLNSAIYLISLSQQVSTFAINFQGRPFREGITENSALYYGLLGVAGVAVCGAIDLIPELNRWLQLVEMDNDFRFKLCAAMVIDYAGAYALEKICKYLFADTRPKALITRGIERRQARRAKEKEEQDRIDMEKEKERWAEMEEKYGKKNRR